MDYQEFHRILTAFADKPAHIDVERGRLIAELRDDIIEATLHHRSGELWVEEDGTKYRASTWIIDRVARLPMLADRIWTQIEDEPHFIEPAGHLLDRLEDAPEDKEVPLCRVTPRILDLLGRRPAGTSTGLYITSDAGEGKTTLIHHLARQQALRYKNKETDWLLVPIALGGRPFLRFDDVIIGTIVSKLRFPFLYYEAFVWLVRMGVIVPALDGFEEMFVEGQAGDAVSSLGNLISILDSQGTVLIAARSAYFEYNRLQVQAPLFDSLHHQQADFARVKLSRWDRSRFVEYAATQGVDGGSLFDMVADRYDESHPLLTRPVLVKRLVNVAGDADQQSLSKALDEDGKHYFERFVTSIIEREAREKWIDRSGEPTRPLLTVLQHHELLADIALEMWVSETASLKDKVFDSVVDLYAEHRHMDAHLTRQISRRIRQHALMVKMHNDFFRFDHEEFYHYFLGRSIASMVVSADPGGIRHALRVARLPRLTVDVATRGIRSDCGDFDTLSKVIDTLNAVCEIELRDSFIKDNSGDLAVRLIDAADLGAVIIGHMSFSVDALKARRIRDIVFRDCFFQRTDLSESTILNCSFERCRFEQIDVSGAPDIRDSSLQDCEVFSVVRPSEETAIFAPESIDETLREARFLIPHKHRAVEIERVAHVEKDPLLDLTVRMCRAFFRSTAVNENTFRQRLGRNASSFFDQILPRLEAQGVVNEVEYRGAGRQKRYQLGVSLDDVQRSIEQADGSFEKFLGGIRS